MTSFQQKILKKFDATFGKFFIRALFFLWKKKVHSGIKTNQRDQKGSHHKTWGIG
jgi:hypothetical protein